MIIALLAAAATSGPMVSPDAVVQIIIGLIGGGIITKAGDKVLQTVRTKIVNDPVNTREVDKYATRQDVDRELLRVDKALEEIFKELRGISRAVGRIEGAQQYVK